MFSALTHSDLDAARVILCFNYWKIVKMCPQSLNILTRNYKCLLNPVVLKLFHVKDPSPKLKVFEKYMFKDLDTISWFFKNSRSTSSLSLYSWTHFHDFSRIADLQAHCELVDLDKLKKKSKIDLQAHCELVDLDAFSKKFKNRSTSSLWACRFGLIFTIFQK